ncbi:MAG TPA: hypothetical protein VIJ53_04965, partial [Acidobacteriaceae bacterium]
LARYAYSAVVLAIALTFPAMAQETPSTTPPPAAGSSSVKPTTSALPDNPKPELAAEATGKQTKRILYVVPNFRSVSMDEILPPQTAKQKFILMLQDSFDYSSFIYVGGLAGVADAEKSYPEFGHGAAAYGRYYWHSFADNVNGNLFTEAIVPIATHEDPRYYTMGRGGIFKRSVYSVSRLLITRSDLTATNHAHDTFNFSEIVGNGAAAGISNLYYPSKYSTWTKTGQKWIVQIGLDGGSNLVKEFWPDVNAHIFHNANW